jgi:hypothetical protein
MDGGNGKEMKVQYTKVKYLNIEVVFAEGATF